MTLGQIFSSFNPWTGEFKGRFTNITRKQSERLLEIPNDSERFLKINRSEEDPETASEFWMVDRGAWQGGGIALTTGINTGTSVIASTEESNPWFNNGSEHISGGAINTQKNGFRGWPEPVKVQIMGTYIVLTPCPIRNSSSTIARAFIEGSYFMLRSEFDSMLQSWATFLKMES